MSNSVKKKIPQNFLQQSKKHGKTPMMFFHIILSKIETELREILIVFCFLKGREIQVETVSNPNNVHVHHCQFLNKSSLSE